MPSQIYSNQLGSVTVSQSQIESIFTEKQKQNAQLLEFFRTNQQKPYSSSYQDWFDELNSTVQSGQQIDTNKIYILFDNSGCLDSETLFGFKKFIFEYYGKLSTILGLKNNVSTPTNRDYSKPVKLKVEKLNKYSKDNNFYTNICCLMLLSGIMLFVLLALCQKIVKMHSFFKR